MAVKNMSLDISELTIISLLPKRESSEITGQYVMSQHQESMPPTTIDSMDNFLVDIERRAFHMAKMATGNREDALDIVQDAMYKLV